MSGLGITAQLNLQAHFHEWLHSGLWFRTWEYRESVCVLSRCNAAMLGADCVYVCRGNYPIKHIPHAHLNMKQKFGVSIWFFLCFWKNYAHQGCIYLLKKIQKKLNYEMVLQFIITVWNIF